MGTKCAPNYANIFKDIFEKTFIYPLVNNMTKLYLQFTNDIFIKWTGTFGQLLEFKQRIEEVYPSIKFDFKFSNKEIKFLDTVVCKTPTGKLDTNLYTKDTDRQAYLHRKSKHPESLKRNIQLAPTSRLRRICTVDKEFQLNCNELSQKLTEREYKEPEINESIEKTQTFDRKELLKEKEKKKTKRIPLILT